MTREEYSPATADTLEKSGWTFAQVPIALFRNHEVSDGAKVLFSYLAWRQGQHTASWPAIGTIASDLDIHEATVRRRIVELEQHGIATPPYETLIRVVADWVGV